MSDAAVTIRATSAEQVAEVMATVLGLDRVEVDEDFFTLGGNSLDAGRLCAGLGELCAQTVPFGQIYRTPRARELADWLRAQTPAAPVLRAVPGEPVALTRGQVNMAQTGDEVVCVLSWWVDGVLDVEALRRALLDVHLRHETLHCRYIRGTPPTAVLPAEPGAPAFATLTAQPDEDQAVQLLDAAVGAPLRIADGQVWRAVLVPLAGGDRALLGLGVHHIAFDGWSQALLVGDLAVAYRARLAGKNPQWTALAPGLAAIAAEEAHSLDGVDLSGQLSYWRGTLRQVKRLDLPGAARGPVPASGPKAGYRHFVPAAGLAVWDEYARARRVTPFGYLVAVFAQVLREVTGQGEVAMMVPVAARGAPLLDATVAARLDAICLWLPGGPGDPVEVAGAVVAAALAAQDLPFSAAVTAMAQVRPDLHVLLTLPVFLLQDNVSNPLELPGCTLQPVDSPLAREAPNPLTVEVFRDTAGATVRITIRTDRIPVEVAESIAVGFGAVLAAGPHALSGAAPKLGEGAVPMSGEGAALKSGELAAGERV